MYPRQHAVGQASMARPGPKAPSHVDTWKAEANLSLPIPRWPRAPDPHDARARAPRTLRPPPAAAARVLLADAGAVHADVAYSAGADGRREPSAGRRAGVWRGEAAGGRAVCVVEEVGAVLPVRARGVVALASHHPQGGRRAIAAAGRGHDVHVCERGAQQSIGRASSRQTCLAASSCQEPSTW